MSHYPHDEPVESVWTDVGGAEMEEPQWVVKNILPVGITFIAGPPKSYKSLVELAVLLSACGVRNQCLPADLSECDNPGRVMLLSGEAMPGVLRHTAKHGLGIDIPEDSRFLAMSDPWRFRLDQPDNVRELLGWFEKLDGTVLAIDPLRNFHSLDENDSGGMIMMLQPLQQYMIKCNKACIIVHHSKKLGEDRDGGKRMANANDMRGSSALFGLADAVCTITAKSNKGLVNIDTVMKRGEAWQRTVQLGVWGQTAIESIDSQTKMIFELLKTGLPVMGISQAMKITKTEVLNAMLSLQRIGALDESGAPTNQGSSIAATAVRKFAKST